MPEDDEDIKGPQPAPASTASSLTEGNADHMSTSAPGKPPPSPTWTSETGSRSATSQHQQQDTHFPLLKGPDSTSAYQQPVPNHPLQAHSQPPTTASSQQGVVLDAPADKDAQDKGQALSTPVQLNAADQSDQAGFGAWASAAVGHGDWGAVEWLARQALPALLASVRMVAPHTETEALRCVPFTSKEVQVNARFGKVRMLGMKLHDLDT